MIKKDDNVIILAGKDKGKTGKVLRVLREKNKIIVEGINMYKHHARPKKQGQKGQMIDKNMPLHLSNVSLIDPKSGKATRVGSKIENGKKVRFGKKSGQVI